MTGDQGGAGDADTAGESGHGDGERGYSTSRRGVLSGTLVGLVGVATPTSATAGGSFTAGSSGDWSDPSTWEGGSVPTDGATVVVPSGVTATVASEVSTRVTHVDVRGTLRHAPDTDTRLRVETIETQSGSRYEVGTTANPVGPDATATVEIIDQGPIDESEWPDRENKGLLARGAVEIVGAEKTPWTTLARPPTAGDASIELSSEPTNWSAGDTVIVPGLDPYESTALDHDDERRTVASVSGTTVTLESPLDHDHVPPESEFDSYALNMSRSVTVASENTTRKRRGHVMLMEPGTDVRYARFQELGRTDKAEPLTNPPRNADTVDADGPNTRARYAFHYHETGIDADPHYAEGIVVDGSPGWGVVNHHSHADVVDSITYDVLGSGFTAEGGNERGSFKRNFALRSAGSGDPVDSRSAGAHGGDPPIDDFGHAGHGFWLQSPKVEVVDNVAAGHRHQAFVWWLRPLLDGDLAEGTSIEDSRVTYHPNLPWEYCDTDRPLFEAIEQDRFANGRSNDVMRNTRKLPSTFADLAPVTGNVAFGAAGGADFSRHNFKWKHQRFSDFNALEEFTVYNVGPFVDENGESQDPGLPRHRASGPTQGRGGSTGVSFRYTSNVALRNSYLRGTGRADSVGVPYHDYRWSVTVDDCTVENWDWGIDSGEHNITWVRGCSLSGNGKDLNWGFDNVGPMIVDDTAFESVRRDFYKRNQKAPEVLKYGRKRGLRIDGRSAYVVESAPDHVLFPDRDSLSGINNIESLIDSVDDETNLVGLTNREMRDQYGIAVAGRPYPDDAVSEPWTAEAVFDPESRSSPDDSLYLDTTKADGLGAFEVVSAQDVAGGEALRWTGSPAPEDDAASVSFDCAAGTYRLHARVRPDAWNGDTLLVRIDGGTWRPIEKIRAPSGFGWHDASPNGGEMYEWDLSAGTHTLEFAGTNDDMYVDEIFLGATDDAEVLGAYGMSQDDTGGVGPAVGSLSLSEVETPDADAAFDATWQVSDADGDLSTLDLTLTDDVSGSTEDTASPSVAGDSASGTTRLLAAGDDGAGHDYTVEAVVSDGAGNTASATASTAESENAPTVDGLSLSEVETPDADAAFDATWQVSDADGNLSAVDLTLTDGTDGSTEDTASPSVAGDSASGTTRLLAAGDDGAGHDYTVEAVVSDVTGATASDSATVGEDEPTEQSPYTDHDLARIQAENFDYGGEGVAYHDTSDGNKGGAYRDTDVDIQPADDVSGQYNLGWIERGEWWEYTVDIPESGEYRLQARLAGKNATTLDVAVDGSQVATVDVPDTGDWQDWTTVDAGTVSLDAGTQTVRLTANGGSFNVNWFGFETERTDQAPYTDHDLARIQAEDFDYGGEGVAYHDTSDGNKGGAYRDTDVDVQTADDVSGRYNLAWVREGEWWEYTVDVPESGEYRLRARLAGKNATTLDVAVDGSQVATVDVPDTGDWQDWTTVDAGTVSLDAGTQTVRLTANGGSFNVNWFGFGSTGGDQTQFEGSLSAGELAHHTYEVDGDADSVVVELDATADMDLLVALDGRPVVPGTADRRSRSADGSERVVVDTPGSEFGISVSARQGGEYTVTAVPRAGGDGPTIQTAKTLVVDGSGEGVSEYGVTVSGDVQFVPEQSETESAIEWLRDTDGGTASGWINGGHHRYRVTGEVLDVTVDGPAEVRLDGEVIHDG